MLTPILYQEFNKLLQLGKFPSEMKLMDVTRVFIKEDRTNKENYEPVSIISNLYNQLSLFFDKILSNYHCGCRKDFNPQHCLINL